MTVSRGARLLIEFKKLLLIITTANIDIHIHKRGTLSLHITARPPSAFFNSLGDCGTLMQMRGEHAKALTKTSNPVTTFLKTGFLVICWPDYGSLMSPIKKEQLN